MSNQNVLTDNELDQKARTEQSEVYHRILQDRESRKTTSLTDYMQSGGFTTTPKHTLDALNKMLEILDKSKTSTTTPENLIWVNNKISEINNLIESNNYAIIDTSDYEYNQSYKAHETSFQWPNQAELDIRSQEEQELIALLQQNT